MSEMRGQGEATRAAGPLALSIVDRVVEFGRALHRAGVRIEPSSVAVAIEALACVDMTDLDQAGTALEASLIRREADLGVFRELFDAWFGEAVQVADIDDGVLLDTAEPIQAVAARRRTELALPASASGTPRVVQRLMVDAVRIASDSERLRQADFATLSADELRDIERHAARLGRAIPEHARRRLAAASCGAGRLDWPATLKDALHHEGEPVRLHRRRPRRAPSSVLVLIDVSGSMERYARIALAFLHAALARETGRDVFAIGTRLTDLTRSFRHGDPDRMLTGANAAIADYAGGTKLGDALASFRRHHGHRLVGGRTTVLFITDGLDTGSAAVFDEGMQWLRRRSRSILWLNPMLRYARYTPAARGASVMSRYADRMLAVHSLDSLDALADTLVDMFSASRWFGQTKVCGPNL